MTTPAQRATEWQFRVLNADLRVRGIRDWEVSAVITPNGFVSSVQLVPVAAVPERTDRGTND